MASKRMTMKRRRSMKRKSRRVRKSVRRSRRYRGGEKLTKEEIEEIQNITPEEENEIKVLVISMYNNLVTISNNQKPNESIDSIIYNALITKDSNDNKVIFLSKTINLIKYIHAEQNKQSTTPHLLLFDKNIEINYIFDIINSLKTYITNKLKQTAIEKIPPPNNL